MIIAQLPDLGEFLGLDQLDQPPPPPATAALIRLTTNEYSNKSLKISVGSGHESFGLQGQCHIGRGSVLIEPTEARLAGFALQLRL